MLDGVITIAGELLNMAVTGILSRDRERTVHSTLRLTDGEANGLVLDEPVEGDAVVSCQRIRLDAVDLTNVEVVWNSQNVRDPALTAYIAEGTAVLVIRIDGGVAEWTVPAGRVGAVGKWLTARE
ncbi:hypothetical protein E1I21_11895 [Microbacterium oleivorans]|uniref:hypothetical protein n=1 Tax=Microbacterium oleivorans TaxID=273677 RepID=UPI0010A55A59|nr:hypothetical protein [Microbacterium oleivorans]THE06450.1 hypothetical protein E1I21_11895 [Microbacterium oleivorans]